MSGSNLTDGVISAANTNFCFLNYESRSSDILASFKEGVDVIPLLSDSGKLLTMLIDNLPITFLSYRLICLGKSSNMLVDASRHLGYPHKANMSLNLKISFLSFI